MAKKTGTVKKKVVKVGAVGNAYVHSTFNNVIITITNEVGDVISWSAAGQDGLPWFEEEYSPMPHRRRPPTAQRSLMTWACAR